MDWARVKTILIIVFLMVNIFLVFKVAEKHTGKELSTEIIGSLKDLISKNGIALEADIPTKISSMPRIKISNKTVDEEGLADKIFGKSKWTKKNEGKISVYYNESLELTVDESGFIKYCDNRMGHEAVNIADQNVIKEKILEIIGNYSNTQDLTVTSFEFDKNQAEIFFSNEYKENEIFNNGVYAKVQKDGKTEIRQGVIDVLGFTSKKRDVSVVDAVVELVRNIKGKQTTKITEISIGYFANLNRNGETIKIGEADPAWRIRTDKEIFIFDGYTGVLLYKSDL